LYLCDEAPAGRLPTNKTTGLNCMDFGTLITYL
jgi:hypothetical protein